MKVNSFARPVQAPEKSDKMREVANLYEKQFLREMVKAMRGTVQSSGLLKRNMAEKIFQEKLDHEYVEKWGDRGGIGLSDLIYQQLQQRFGNVQQRPKQGMLPVEPSQLRSIRQTPTGMDIILESESPKTEQIKPGLPGKVKGAFVLPEGKSAVTMEHEDGLHSRLVFSGQLADLTMGQNLSEGDVIGTLPPNSDAIYWSVTRGQSHV